MATTAVACAWCGGLHAAGPEACPQCGVPGSAQDVLVFVRRVAGRDRRAARTRLTELFGDRIGTPVGRAAARGDRPLLRVPAELGSRTADSLEAHGVAARCVPVRRAWTAMPHHFFALLAAITAVGGAAGAVAVPGLLLLSPLLAGSLLVVAHWSVARPLLRAPVRARFPSDVETGLAAAFAQLSAGRARERLADLADIARPLLHALRRDEDPADLATALAELVRVACSTAHEVDRLDAMVRVVEDERAGPNADELRDAACRCAAAAATGYRRLGEAVAVIAGIGSLAGDDGERLSDLTRQLRDEAGRRESALREVDQLLAR